MINLCYFLVGYYLTNFTSLLRTQLTLMWKKSDKLDFILFLPLKCTAVYVDADQPICLHKSSHLVRFYSLLDKSSMTGILYARGSKQWVTLSTKMFPADVWASEKWPNLVQISISLQSSCQSLQHFVLNLKMHPQTSPYLGRH